MVTSRLLMARSWDLISSCNMDGFLASSKKTRHRPSRCLSSINESPLFQINDTVVVVAIEYLEKISGNRGIQFPVKLSTHTMIMLIISLDQKIQPRSADHTEQIERRYCNLTAFSRDFSRWFPPERELCVGHCVKWMRSPNKSSGHAIQLNKIEAYLPSKMGIRTLAVQIDDLKQEYFPGNQVSGRVVLEISEELKVRSYKSACSRIRNRHGVYLMD
ncbi:hypothetical protein MAR_024658 [Mya arenaria]|uniref:Uncharacterized protein n=1 Tax=Mya arenaria TaxID=6604 RepID=A0ABY7DVF5_MYAAR|nr:hypothetical protein MAR_024658 [Mya arenaria]